MAKKKAPRTHNDIDDLPPDEPAQDFDDESPSDVLGIDLPSKEPVEGKKAASAEPKPTDRPEPDERPGQDVLEAVAAEAAEGDERPDDDTTGDDEPDEGAAADDDSPDADDDAEPQMRTVKFERNGEMIELTVPESEAKFLESYISASDVTRDKYATLQAKYTEAIKGTPAQDQATAAAQNQPSQAPAEAANARLNQMMGVIPQVVEAYKPVLDRMRDSLPEENEIRVFIEDNPAIAAILAAMWDGQTDLQTQGARQQAERAQTAFRDHVDGLINQIIQSDEANTKLADPDVRDEFDAYLVSLGPRTADGTYDPTPVRAALMRDDGSWLAERWRDFMLRTALKGAKPTGGEKDAPRRSTDDVSRRRAIDPGSARSGSRPNARKSRFSKEVSDVLGAD